MIRIGLGITTCNNKESLVKLINSIKKYTDKVPYTLYCAVDGSTDGTVEYLMDQDIEFVYGPAVGPAKNKNRIIRRFFQYNYMFIINDTMEITSEGWVELFISAAGLFNYPYFIFPEDKLSPSNPGERMGDMELSLVNTYSDNLLFYTRRSIEKVGAMDERLYGREASKDQYYRLYKGKMVPHPSKGYPIIQNAFDYMKCESSGLEVKDQHTINDITNMMKLKSEIDGTGNVYRKL